MRKPPLVARIAWGHQSGGTWCGVAQSPPGRSVPGCSLMLVSLGSLQARNTSSEVFWALGRTLVVYTAGNPPTVGPAGFHSPSPASGVGTGLATLVGGVVCGRGGMVVTRGPVVVLVVVDGFTSNSPGS